MTESKLREEFPDLIGKGKVASGLYIPDGWSVLVGTLLQAIRQSGRMIIIDQIKEKFGVLNFYYHGEESTYITNLVTMAVKASSLTCQKCGAYGTRRGGDWIRVLCDPCLEPPVEEEVNEASLSNNAT